MRTLNPDAQAAARSKSSQVANPGGGGGTTYPSTSHQKRATRSGSAQSKVTWNCLTDAIGPPYRQVPRTQLPRDLTPATAAMKASGSTRLMISELTFILRKAS